MNILIYKRTHTGDPNPSGIFGLNGCMRSMRNQSLGIVIGIGGLTTWPGDEKISRKINWIGTGAKRCGRNKIDNFPIWNFERFELYEEKGPLLEEIAPTLANRFFLKNARFLKDFSKFSDQERKEAKKLVLCFLNGDLEKYKNDTYGFR